MLGLDHNYNEDLRQEDRPAIYEGESYRSGYTRGKQHWSKYNTKSGQKTSFMYHHSTTNHSGTIGPDRGKDDYRLQVLEGYNSNIKRKTNEGRDRLR